MKVFQTSEKLIIKENPGCLWLFGFFFTFWGILFIYGAYNGFVLFGINSPWAVNLTFFIGLMGIGLGVWFIYTTPINNLEIDKTAKTVKIIRWGIFGKKVESYRFDEVERFSIIESQNKNELTVLSFGVELVDGEQSAITSLGQYAEDYESKYVYPINVFIGKEFPSCQLNFPATIEADEELN